MKAEKEQSSKGKVVIKQVKSLKLSTTDELL